MLWVVREETISYLPHERVRSTSHYKKRAVDMGIAINSCRDFSPRDHDILLVDWPVSVDTEKRESLLMVVKESIISIFHVRLIQWFPNNALSVACCAGQEKSFGLNIGF